VLPNESTLDATKLFDITGARALVTGGGSGLGRSMALALRDAGAKVAIVGRSEKVLAGKADGLRPLMYDLSSNNAASQVIDECVKAWGGLDILVNAHGIATRSKAEGYDMAAWQNTIDVNLVSVFRICQAAGREFLRAGHGKIINIASMLSFSGGLTASAYAASKGGIAQMTKALANEWAARGINVNAIAPGYFETPMTEPLRNDPVRNQEILARLPAKRWGKPQELAGALIFLSSSASDYVHGAVLAVDGGWLAR
jgi:2-deoxy-D-gluconate 3-dehydrogenase